jgi:hypothetical protein
MQEVEAGLDLQRRRIGLVHRFSHGVEHELAGAMVLHRAIEPTEARIYPSIARTTGIAPPHHNPTTESQLNQPE